MLQVCAIQLCKCISFFVSKTVREERAFVNPIHAPKQLKRVNHKLNWWAIDAPLTWRFRKGSSGSEKSLFSTGQVEEKANFLDSWTILLWSYTIKKPNTTGCEKRPAATVSGEIDDRSREADVNAVRGSIELFFFSSASSSSSFFLQWPSNYFRFAFLLLKVGSPDFSWKISISISSAKISHLRILRGLLACGPLRPQCVFSLFLVTWMRKINEGAR